MIMITSSWTFTKRSGSAAGGASNHLEHMHGVCICPPGATSFLIIFRPLSGDILTQIPSHRCNRSTRYGIPTASAMVRTAVLQKTALNGPSNVDAVRLIR